MSQPIETKVITGAGAGGLTAATITPAVLWFTSVLFFGGSTSSASADVALMMVPWPIGTFLAAVIVTAGTFLGGYIGRHTARPDVDATD